MSVPTVFFLHYLGGSRRTWTPVLDLMSDAVPVVAVDLPGFGDAARTHGYAVSEMADAVMHAIRRHQPRHWLLVGHSMGAKVAAVVARTAEDGGSGLGGLAGLVLAAGSPPGPEPMDREKRDTLLSWFQGDKASSRHEAERYVQDNVSRPLAPDCFDLAVRDVLRANRAAWVAWLESGSREDWSDRVGVLSTPTLVLAGAEDDALGPAAQRQLVLPHLRQPVIETLHGVGHLLPLERPDTLAPRILEHAALVR